MKRTLEERVNELEEENKKLKRELSKLLKLTTNVKKNFYNFLF